MALPNGIFSRIHFFFFCILNNIICSQIENCRHLFMALCSMFIYLISFPFVSVVFFFSSLFIVRFCISCGAYSTVYNFQMKAKWSIFNKKKSYLDPFVCHFINFIVFFSLKIVLNIFFYQFCCRLNKRTHFSIFFFPLHMILMLCLRHQTVPDRFFHTSLWPFSFHFFFSF